MNGQPGYFPHYEKDGAWVSLKLTTRPRIDRLGVAGYRKAKTDDLLGSMVSGRARAHVYDHSLATITGQVWAPADASLRGPGMWWVVDSTGHAWLMYERSMTTLSARSEQLSLEDAS